MGKLSKSLERRRQQARIAAHQASIEAAAAATAEPEPPRPAPSATPAAPAAHAPAVHAPTAPVAPVEPRAPIPSTLPQAPAIEIPVPEPAPLARRVRRSDRRRADRANGEYTGTDNADRPEPGSGGRAAAIAVALCTIGTIVAVDVGIGRGAPVLGHSWDLWALASSAAAIALMLAVARTVFAKKQWAATRRQLITAAVTGVLAVAAFTIGVTSSVVIDGQVMAATSDAARAHSMATEMLLDIDRLSSIDELVATDAAQAQARFREFEGAQRDAQEIADRWAQVDVASLPAGELVPAVEGLKQAGFAAAKAVETRAALLGTSDAKLASDVATMRNAYIEAALSVGPAIGDVERRFGFTVGPGPEDELE